MNEIVESNGQRALSAADIRAQVNLIQEVMKSVMQGPSKEHPEGVHYGILPGSNKPSLYKPGAEKLATTFRIAVNPEVEDLSTETEKRYRVRAVGTSNGVFVGAGIGEASTNETKYRWRKVTSHAEFEATAPNERKIKYYGNEKTEQVWTNPSDLANTVLKMAKKRALVDLILTATAASDIFTQDIEDLPEGIQLDDKPAKPVIAQPQRKQEDKPKDKIPTPTENTASGEDTPQDNRVPVVITDVRFKEGTNKNGKPYKLFSVLVKNESGQDETYGTFDEKLATFAKDNKGTGVILLATIEPSKNPKYDSTLLSLDLPNVD